MSAGFCLECYADFGSAACPHEPPQFPPTTFVVQEFKKPKRAKKPAPGDAAAEQAKREARRDATGPSEAETQRLILVTHGARRDLRLWRANTGKAMNPNGRLVTFGVPGQPDIMGLRLPHGQLIGIEVKSKTGKQRPDQIAFQAMMERFGGLYILARSLEDVDRVLGKAP